MAKNPESVPKVKPESVSMVSIVTKLQEVDVTLSKIVKENTKIKCECDCVEVKKENVILKNKIMEIEKVVQNMNNFLSSNQLGHVLPDALPSDVPSVNANLTQLEKGIADSNANTDVLPNPDISVNGNKNTNVSNSESNVSLNDLPNKETIRETDIEVITQNLATLDLTSDEDASSTLPAPVSETGTKSDTEGTDTTVVQEENVRNNAQEIEEGNIDRNTNDNTKNNQSVRQKSKGSLKHERNVNKTQEAISAANKAVRNGATDEEARAIGMEAAKAVCKSYAQILNKSQAKTTNKNNTSTQSKSNKSRPSHISQYKKGKCESSLISIAAKKPKYLEGKCLVVSRVKSDSTKVEFINYINSIAGKNVKFLSSPRNVAKEYSNWRTIEIEISDEDYQILSNPEIWDSELRIKDFVGRRYWHNKASTMTANQRKSAVYIL